MKRWKGRLVFLVFFVLFAGIGLSGVPGGEVAYAAVQKEFYVSPAGSDSTGNGSVAAPYATLDKARETVRAYLAANTLNGDVVVYLRGGTYPLAAPVVFDASDSGKDGFEVVYRNMPGEKPVLSGGTAAEGWTLDGGSIYKAYVGTSADFRQIYVNETRGVRAREPETGSYYTMPTEKVSDGFNLPLGQLNGVTYAANQIEVSVLIEWMHKRLRVSNASDIGGYTRAVINPIEWDDINNQPQGYRNYLGRSYWFENAKAFLDTPGEWYFDKPNGYLYYWPRAGENISTAEVIVPETESLIRLNGSFSAPVENLRFQGLEFRHTNWTRPNEFGFVDVQANSLIPSPPNDNTDAQYRHNQRKDRIPGAFHATTSNHIVIEDSKFKNLGGTGILFTMGGNDNLFKGNSLSDIAGGGIEIGNDAFQPTDAGMWPRRNAAVDNYITRIGRDYFGSVGILGYYNDSLLVEHNEIVDVPYTGISVGWGWTPVHCAAESKNNKIRNNLVADFMKGANDGGGIYTLCAQTGSEMTGNYVKNQYNNFAGIYLDGSSQNYLVTGNVVSNTPEWLYVQIYGDQIASNNNIQYNYADNNHYRAREDLNTIANNVTVTGGNWPAEAVSIMNNAGLEPSYHHLREGTNPDPGQDPNSVIVDNTDGGFAPVSGTWYTSGGLPGKYGSDYRYAVSGSSPLAKARWTPQLSSAGVYKVYVWYAAYANRCTKCPYTVNHDGGSQTVAVDQTAGGGGWVLLGSFPFASGTAGSVELTSQANGLYLNADAVKFERVPDIIVDNADAGFSAVSGTWYTLGSLPGKYGTDYRYAVSGATATAKARWTPSLPTAGQYKVYVWFPSHASRCSNCPYTVNYNGGSQTVGGDQTTGGGGWVLLGTYAFNAGTLGNVELTNQANGSYVGADAVKFEYAGVAAADATPPVTIAAADGAAGEDGYGNRDV